MKKTIIFFVVLFFQGFVFAQTDDKIGGVPVTDAVWIKKSETAISHNSDSEQNSEESFSKPSPSGPTGNSTEFGVTAGQLFVSLTGGATYDIPIAVPPGINGVVPQVSLSYNSQAGNGLAGYGWNVSGVSVITRIPATKFHDGTIDAVDFDQLDRFSLDGQRLVLKSGLNGVYGGEGTKYETENFSNLRITSHGVHHLGLDYGPASFKVEYPDGSFALYGETFGSRSINDWAITYWQNPQGIRISYTYTKSNNNLSIKSIKYGSRLGYIPINEIYFVYKTRQRLERAYIGGRNFVRNSILSQIRVKGNGEGYRNYYLEHDVTSLGYERLKKITERSGDDSKSLNPTVFTYKTTPENIKYPTETSLSNFMSQIKKVRADNSDRIVGDFNGNGKMDFILYPTTGDDAKKKYWLFSKWENGYDYMDIIEHVNINFKEIFPVSWLSYENKLMSAQGWCIVSETATNKVKFQTCSRGASNPIVLQYEKTHDFPKYQYSYYKKQCNGNTEEFVSGEKIIPKIYLSGDFNGDGLSDIVAIEKEVTIYYVTDCKNHFVGNVQGRSFFIELDRRKNTNFVKYSGKLITTDNSKIYVADFNGDGKSDILVFDNKSLRVYSLNNNNNFEQVYSIINDNDINVSQSGNPIILGDYNGDGKTDFLIPNGYGNNFFRYISTGKGYVKTTHSYGVSYTKSEQFNNGSTKIYYLIPSDFDLDGKTDLILAECRGFNNPNSNSPTYIKVKYYKNTGSNFEFMSEKSTGYKGDKIIHYPAPIFLDINEKTNSSISFMTNNSIYTFESEKSNIQDMLLRNITLGNGLKEEITYQPLDENYVFPDNYDLSAYNPSYSDFYPNFDIKTSNNFHIVSKIEQVSASQYRKQIFKYYGAVTNLEGLGFLGFRELHRTNWFAYNNGNDAITTITKHDLQKRGAISEIYTTQGAYFNSFNYEPTNYITKTKLTYQDELLPNKVYKIKNTYSVIHNALEGFSKSVSTTYDNYNNPLEVTTSFYNGNIIGQLIPMDNLKFKDLKTFEYDNNTTNSENYYIGRPKKLQSESQIFGSQTLGYIGPNLEDTRTSEEIYTYNDKQLPIKIQKKGHNTNYITENNTYDVFGNIIKKTIEIDAFNKRSTEYTYDSTKRFLLTSKDVEGLITSYSYNINNGNLLSETLPHNPGFPLTTTFEYDVWGRQTKIVDYLGKEVKTSYFKHLFDNKTDVIYTLSDSGSASLEMFNQLGQKIAITTKDFSGNHWSAKLFKYDINDRITHESEPFFVNAPFDELYTSKWNKVDYDLYGRVTKQRIYSGKTTNISYNGLSQTTNVNFKTTTITKNAAGNIVSLTDNGGAINYKYYADGNLKEANYNGVIVSVEQDGWGRKTKLTDPSAGQYTYEYNGFGELTKETTPKGQTTYILDNLGKIEQKIITGDNTDTNIYYEYNSTTKLLSEIVHDDFEEQTTYTYQYDNYRRLHKTIENGPLTYFEHYNWYDDFGRIEKERYKAVSLSDMKTSDKTVKHTYKNGYHWQILDEANSQVLWQTNSLNVRGQLTGGLFGNGVSVNNTYDDYGFPQLIKHEKTEGENPLNMELTTKFDIHRETLSQRTNNLFDWSEKFLYDQFDRLRSIDKSLILLEQNDFKYYLGGFYANAGATLSIVNQRLKVTGMQAYARTQKTITENAQIGDQFHIEVYVDKGNTQQVRVVIVESDPETGQWNQSIKIVESNAELVEFDHIVSQYPVVRLHIDKSDTSDTGISTYFFVEYFKAYKISSQGFYYDDRGRTWLNSNLGHYYYQNTDRPYQNTSIIPTSNNSDFDQLYGQLSNLNCTYNVFKAPVDIFAPDKERLSFRYNAFGQRSTMFYGGLHQNKIHRHLRKHYSADGSMEIKQNIQTGQTEFITYIGGDGYSASVVLKSNGTNQEYLYLHRDYQGSIIAISNQQGQLVEKRLFDAWGNIINVRNGQNKNLLRLTILDRGYTGHEHLQKINIINMNGRLYDPVVHRFLQPDNFVQDPFNTQNFNRYAYCLNNPFMYVDYTGETHAKSNSGGSNDLLQIGGAFIAASIAASYREIKKIEFNHWADRNLRSIGKDVERYGRDTGKFFEKIANDIARFFGFGRNKPSSITVPSINFSDTSTSTGWHESTTFTSVAGMFGNYRGSFTQNESSDNSLWIDQTVRTIADFVPLVGSGWDIYEGITDDNYWQITIGSVSLIADLATFGGASLIKGGIKTGIKQGGKHLAKDIVKKESKLLLNQFNSVESLIENAGKLERLKGSVHQGFVKGNIDDVFKSIIQGGKYITPYRVQLPNGTIITKYSSSTTGTPTLQINKGNQIFKIRIK